MKCQILFSRKNNKNLSKCRLLLPSMQSVKFTMTYTLWRNKSMSLSLPAKQNNNTVDYIHVLEREREREREIQTGASISRPLLSVT